MISPVTPVCPIESVPGDARLISIPSGVITLDHSINTLLCSIAISELYWPINLEPLGIKILSPVSENTFSFITARIIPGNSELISVSSIAAITLPCNILLSRFLILFTFIYALFALSEFSVALEL